MTLCNAGAWHAVFVVQTLLVLSLALANFMMGIRYRLGWLTVPPWVALRFSQATALAGAVPLATGLWLREKVRVASLSCYLEHPLSGCTHNLVDRATEMNEVMAWVGWVEAVLLGASMVGVALLRRR